MKIIKHLLLMLLLVAATQQSKAQSWEVGGWLGFSYAFDDINTEYRFDNPNMAMGVMSRLNFSPRLSVKLSGNFAQIGGDDQLSNEPFQKQRNLSYRSNVFDGTFQFEFNFLEYEHGSDDHFFTPYLFVGATIFWFNPQAEYEGEWVELQPLGTEGQFRGDEYNLIQPAIAYGGGFKFDLSYEWSVNVEISARKLFTDYLDDVSTLYPDLEDLQDARGSIAVALADRSIDGVVGESGRQRGNSQDTDMYAFVGLSLIYNFAAVKCFKFY